MDVSSPSSAAPASSVTQPHCTGNPTAGVLPSGAFSTGFSKPAQLFSSAYAAGSSLPQPTVPNNLFGMPSSMPQFSTPARSSSRYPPGFQHPAQYTNPMPTPMASTATSIFSLPHLSAHNLTNLVTITLSSPEDYLLWKTQITCLLISHQLLGFVDGSAPIPPATIIDEHGNSVPNEHFYEYLRIDQQVKSWIFATLSRDVFVDVHDLLTSVDIWNRLQSRFMHASMARSIELKGKLSHIKKTASQSMDGYLREIKVIADSLAAIQCPVSNSDLVQFTLFGLERDPEYDHIEQRIKSSKDESDLSSHHALVAVQSTGPSSSNTRNNSGGRNKNKNNRNKGGTNGRYNTNRGTGGNNPHRGATHNNINANRGRQNGNTSQSGTLHSTPTPDTCGLCWFPGHQAAYCPQRFNSSFVPSSSDSVTRALAALSVGGETNDTVWYPDSGAASHMTPQDGQDNGGGSASGIL